MDGEEGTGSCRRLATFALCDFDLHPAWLAPAMIEGEMRRRRRLRLKVCFVCFVSSLLASAKVEGEMADVAERGQKFVSYLS